MKFSVRTLLFGILVFPSFIWAQSSLPSVKNEERYYMLESANAHNLEDYYFGTLINVDLTNDGSAIYWGWGNSYEKTSALFKTSKDGTRDLISPPLSYDCQYLEDRRYFCDVKDFHSGRMSPNGQYYYYVYRHETSTNGTLEMRVYRINDSVSIGSTFYQFPADEMPGAIALNNLGNTTLTIYKNEGSDTVGVDLVKIDRSGAKTVLESFSGGQNSYPYSQFLYINDIGTVFVQQRYAPYAIYAFPQKTNTESQQKIFIGNGTPYNQYGLAMQPSSVVTPSNPEGVLYYISDNSFSIRSSDGQILYSVGNSVLAGKNVVIREFHITESGDIFLLASGGHDKQYIVKNNEILIETLQKIRNIELRVISDLRVNASGQFTFLSHDYYPGRESGLTYHLFRYGDIVLPPDGDPELDPIANEDEPFKCTPGITSSNIPGGSIVNALNGSVTESVPVIGEIFSLNYASDRFTPSSGFNPVTLGLGGWTPSIVHYYNIQKKTLYTGSGGIRKVEAAVSNNDEYTMANSGASEVYFFNSQGWHLRTRDALTGQVLWSFQYNTNGTLSKIMNRFGQVSSLIYSSNFVSLKSNRGQVTKINLVNNLAASIVRPSGATYWLETDPASGRVLSFTKPEGQKSTFIYSSDGKLLKDESNGGSFIELLSSFNSSTQTQTIDVRTASGLSTVYETSTSNGDRQSRTIASSGATSVQNTSSTGGNNSYVDTFGGVFQATQAEDPRFGLMSLYNSSTQYAIPDQNINITTSTTKTVELSNPNDPLSVKKLVTQKRLQGDPSRTFKSVYDKSSGVITELSPLNRVVYKKLGPQGQLTGLQIANLTPVQYQYNSTGDLLQKITHGTRKIELSYNGVAQIKSIKNPLGEVQSFEYDADNRPVKITDSNGKSTLFGYDGNGNLTSLKPAGRPAHTFSYNLFDLASSYLPPLLGGSRVGEISYQYNLDKKMTRITKPDGSEININYNNTTGLLEGYSTPEGFYTTEYHQSSELISAAKTPDQQVTGFYYVGPYKEAETQSGAVSSHLYYGYNRDASVSGYSIQGYGTGNDGQEAFSVSLFYDKDSLVTRVGNISLTRNNFGAVSKTDLYSIKENIEYNSFGEYLKSSFKFKNQNFNFEVTRDSLGRIIATEEHGPSGKNKNHFKYDKAGRLIYAEDNGREAQSYSYDDNGNRIKKVITDGRKSESITAEYDQQDRLIRYGNTRYFYNDNGELVKKVEDPNNQKNFFWRFLLRCFHGDKRKITLYAYNSFGSLTSVTLPDGRVISYILDAQNRRLAKLVDGDIVNRYVYLSSTQIGAELDADGNITKSYVYASKSNIPDYVVTEDKTYRLVSNQVGTPLMLVDANTGKIEKEFAFDEFGIPVDEEKNKFGHGFGHGGKVVLKNKKSNKGFKLPYYFVGYHHHHRYQRGKSHGYSLPKHVFKDRKPSSPISNDLEIPFGFAGGLYDADTGLVHFGAREYDPEVGRWTSKDPILFAGGDMNLYGYVANDPVNWIDPTGLARGDWWDPRTYVLPIIEAGEGSIDFARNYIHMREANTIGADKYFHCMANCQSTQRGPGGYGAAVGISEGRELFDQYIKGDSENACNADRAANEQGRNGAISGGTCNQICGSFRPNNLSPIW